MGSVLVIEDEVTLANNIATYLARHHHEVRIADTEHDGLKQYESFRPDIVVLDFKLGKGDGLTVLEKIRELEPNAKVIFITAYGGVDIAVQAMKLGAYDYLSKPLILSELRVIIDRGIRMQRLETTLSYYHRKESETGGLSRLAGESVEFERLKQQVSRIVASDQLIADGTLPAVLITGETGTGKELVARALHFEGPRRDSPFVELNCAAIPDNLIEAELFGYEKGAFTDAKSRKIGLFEAANGGTLFLDEIGDVSAAVQVKLLRALEEKVVRRIGSVRDTRVDIRVIAATNRPLEQLIEEGTFRADLYFRLRILELVVPPLRERGEDVLLLARHFLQLHGRRYRRQNLTLSPEAEAKLSAYHWPGNIRELRNVIEQAVLLAPQESIGEKDLMLLSPHSGTSRLTGRTDGRVFVLPSDGIKIEEIERDFALQALQRSGWNVSQAAQLLGLSRDTLRYRMEKYDIIKPES